MKPPREFREPIPTMPDEPMTRPSGIRSLAPGAKPVPEEIREMVRRVLDVGKGGLAVRKITADSTVISDRLKLLPGMDTPAVHVSRVTYTDGEVTSFTSDRPLPESLKKAYSLAALRKSKEPPDITFTVRRRIDNADYIAVSSYTNDNVKNTAVIASSLEVYAREPLAVLNYIETLRRQPDDPSE